MKGSVILHPCVDKLIGCVDKLIGISHQTHYRLLIFVCPVPLGLQPGRPGGYLYRLRRNQRIPALVEFDPILSDDKFLYQKLGLGNPN